VRRALLIGSEVDGLTGVHADIEIMDETLTALGFTTIPTTGADATADGITDRYRGLIEATTSSDAALVYYSGHGARVPTPGAHLDPTLPAWLQYIVPTDHDDRSTGRSRYLLAEELSLLQLELTARTRNVTVVLDCCHAARMSRDPALVPRALARTGAARPDLVRRWAELRADPRLAAVQTDSNPYSVRLVACSPDETAFELPSPALGGGQYGALTAALVPLLRSADMATTTWWDVLDVVRGVVVDAVGQRPEVEGPGDRLLFGLDRRDRTGVRPVRITGEIAVLTDAGLFGLAAGDRFDLVAPGGSVTDPLGSAVVDRIVDGRAVLRLDGVAAADLPGGTAAWPREVALGSRPVVVGPPGAASRPAVVAELVRSARIRVVDESRGAFATVQLDGGIQILDAAGLPLYAGPGPASALLLAEDVRTLARAAHVRALPSGRGSEELPSDVDVTWVRVLPGGGHEVLGENAHLFVGDPIVARFDSHARRDRFASVLDVGLSGALTVLTTSEPEGVSLAPGEGYVLGGPSGFPAGWPAGLPAGSPRTGTLVTIIADAKIEGLSRLAQPGVLARSPRVPATTLGRLIDDVAVGRRDFAPPAVDPVPVRYRVVQLDYVLHPSPRGPDGSAEPPFQLDERPDPSFRLVVPRGRAAPRRIAVRLTELTVHSNRALLASRVRVDTLVVTASGDGGEPCRATTARFDRGRDGDRLPVDDLLLYEGPAHRFLDLAVWVGRDESRDRDLAELFAAELSDREVAAATATLVGLAVAAPAAALVAGALAAVAVVVRTAARLLDTAGGSGIGVYRTALLPHEGFGSGDGIGRHPVEGLRRAQDMSFAFEVIDLDAV
jgi:Caspase domain